jgi:hypothetical protein
MIALVIVDSSTSLILKAPILFTPLLESSYIDDLVMCFVVVFEHAVPSVRKGHHRKPSCSKDLLR